MQLRKKTKTENKKQKMSLKKGRQKTKAMKTKNNVQKAILRWAAVFVSFVLISFTVSAQDFWKRLLENSSFNDIAIAMVEVPVETKSSEVPAESQEVMCFGNELEPEMEIENAMMDFSKFDVNVFQYQEEKEEGLNVETWMMNEDVFGGEDDQDKSLELENWMTSEKVWTI